jgi:hypothetical protein
MRVEFNRLGLPPRTIECPHCRQQFAYPRNPWELLYATVDMNGPIPLHRPWLGTCEVWRGKVHWQTGRGVLHVNGVRWLVHRLAYTLHYGPIAPGLVVCHDCDNPLCVRPDHLFLATQAGNQRDMVAKGRQATAHLSGWRNPRSVGRETALEIRTLWAAGGSTRAAIARKYGLSHNVVSRIVSGERYRNL